jgi:putative addiction module killer protein
MVEVATTNVFDTWFDGLRDRRAKALIEARISRIELGGFGDHKFFRGSESFVSPMAPATGSTSSSAATLS